MAKQVTRGFRFSEPVEAKLAALKAEGQSMTAIVEEALRAKLGLGADAEPAAPTSAPTEAQDGPEVEPTPTVDEILTERLLGHALSIPVTEAVEWLKARSTVAEDGQIVVQTRKGPRPLDDDFLGEMLKPVTPTRGTNGSGGHTPRTAATPPSREPDQFRGLIRQEDGGRIVRANLADYSKLTPSQQRVLQLDIQREATDARR